MRRVGPTSTGHAAGRAWPWKGASSSRRSGARGGAGAGPGAAASATTSTSRTTAARVALVLRGALAASVTPLRDGGATVDDDGIGPVVDFLVDGGVAGPPPPAR